MGKNEEVGDKKHVEKESRSRAKRMKTDVMTELNAYGGRCLASAVGKLFIIQIVKNMGQKC